MSRNSCVSALVLSVLLCRGAALSASPVGQPMEGSLFFKPIAARLVLSSVRACAISMPPKNSAKEERSLEAVI